MNQQSMVKSVHEIPVTTNPTTLTAENYSSDFVTSFELCRSHARRGSYAKAIPILEHATHLEPANHEALLYLAQLYSALGNYKDAIQILKKGMRESEHVTPEVNCQYFYRVALAYQMDGKYREGIKYYTRFIEHVKEGEQYPGFLSRGICYHHLNCNEKALADIERAVALSIKLQRAHGLCYRGRVRAKLGNLKGSREDFMQARSLLSASPDKFLQGVLDNELGDHARAIENFTEALADQRHDIDAYFRRGISYAALGKTDKAITDYTKAIGKNKSHHRAYFRRGVAYVELGQLEDALDDYTTSIKIANFNSDVYLAREQLYLQLKRFDEAGQDRQAATYLDQVVVLADDDIDAGHSNPPSTEEAKQTARFIDPNSPYGKLMHALERQKNGDIAGAMLELNHLLDPDSKSLDDQKKEFESEKELATDVNELQNLKIHIMRATSVMSTQEKHKEAIKKFGKDANLNKFYWTVFYKLEAIFTGCKTVASGFVEHSVEGNLGIYGKGIALVGKVISLVPTVGEPLGSVIDAVVSVVTVIDHKRQREIIQQMANLGSLLDMWEASQLVAYTLTERYRPLLSRLLPPDTERDTLEADMSKCFAWCKKTKQKALKEEYKTQANEIAEYAVLQMLEAMQAQEIISAENKPVDQQLIDVICLPLKEKKDGLGEHLHLKKDFGFNTRQIATREGSIWTLDGFYNKPSIYVESEKKQYGGKDTDAETYGYRMGTKEEVDKLGFVLIDG